MTHPIDVLERLAREGEPAAGTLQLMAGLAADVREAIHCRDADALATLLSGRSTMACMVTLPDQDAPLPDEDQPASPQDEPEDMPSDTPRAA